MRTPRRFRQMYSVRGPGIMPGKLSFHINFRASRSEGTQRAYSIRSVFSNGVPTSTGENSSIGNQCSTVSAGSGAEDKTSSFACELRSEDDI
jgi:hypothetical protein